MKLKERFREVSIGSLHDIQCEKIADDFAIGFAEWVVKTNAFLDYGYDEALQIYKKEQGI